MTGKKFRSVWDALEDTDAARAHMKARAEVLIALQERLAKQPGTQASKAATLGITQPRLNDLLRGRIDKFSLDALVNLASRAGLRVRLQIGRAAWSGSVPLSAAGDRPTDEVWRPRIYSST